MKIAVVGSGYVGLVTAACLAEIGNAVWCLDISAEKIKKLQKGIIPIYEPGLEEFVRRNAKAGRLTFSTKLQSVSEAEVVFIAVGTPPASNGEPNLQNVYAVAKSLGVHMHRRMIIVNKSTVPVGTAVEVEAIVRKELRRRRKSIDFAVVSNPEFLKEGTAIMDFMKPDRIVLGSDKQWATKKMNELYSPFVKNGHPILAMDRESSEMSKYASNAMLACKISFINQMANLCELVGADIELVRKALGHDPRIGTHFMYAGVGYGGSCLPKDVQALNALAKKQNFSAPLFEAIEFVNQQQKLLMPNKLVAKYGKIQNKTYALWGLTFKPNTDDIREAPALSIIESILAQGGRVTVYDPKAMPAVKKIFGNKIRYAKDKYSACRDAHALFVVTEWAEFSEPDFERIKTLLKKPIVFDGRNLYNPNKLRTLGFTYHGVGR